MDVCNSILVHGSLMFLLCQMLIKQQNKFFFFFLFVQNYFALTYLLDLIYTVKTIQCFTFD